CGSYFPSIYPIYAGQERGNLMVPLRGAKVAKATGMFFCLCMISCLAGCARIWQSFQLSVRDGDIKKATTAIKGPNNDALRAGADADRADAYAEKARYARTFKLISSDEYERLFGLAIRDYEQAIRLDADNAEVYFRRGRAYYMRAGLDVMEGKKNSDFF